MATEADLCSLTRDGLPIGTLPVLAGELSVERNPTHPDMAKLIDEPAKPFLLDARLFR